MAKLTALLLAGLFAVAFSGAVRPAKAPQIVFKDPEDNSKCTMKKTGNVLASEDCRIQGTDLGLRPTVKTWKASVDNLVGEMTTLKSKVSTLKSFVSKIDSGVHGILCKDKVPSNSLKRVLKVDGARAVHGDALCRYDCKTGRHDADNNGDCVLCLTSCDPGFQLAGACTSETATTCEYIEHYCPGTLPSIVAGADDLPSVANRKVATDETDNSVAVTCKGTAGSAGGVSLRCEENRQWELYGYCVEHDSCWSLKEGGADQDGYYDIVVDGRKLRVYCDMTRNGGGWTKVMHGVANSHLHSYSANGNDMNIPSNGDTSKIALTTTWKFSDDLINALESKKHQKESFDSTSITTRSRQGDLAATMWVEGLDTCNGGNHYYQFCDYEHTSASKGLCAKSYRDVKCTNEICSSESRQFDAELEDWPKEYDRLTKERAVNKTVDYAHYSAGKPSGHYHLDETMDEPNLDESELDESEQQRLESSGTQGEKRKVVTATGSNYHHGGAGCSSGRCTHTWTTSNRGWYFGSDNGYHGGCRNGQNSGCNMAMWVR